MELLPDYMLANVLGRLPPCSLAASRCVRKHWCSIVDARRLLRADLLPLRLDAFFCNTDTVHVHRPSFFAHPSAARRVGSGGCLASTDRLHALRVTVRDHCNGLILAGSFLVANPATRQVVSLPSSLEEGSLYTSPYLAYDPMVSPHDYQVVVTHSGTGSEWLPWPYTAHVFSSREWRWEKRSFLQKGGEAAATIAGMMPHNTRAPSRRQAVYFRGALYVHLQNDAVIK